MAKKNKAKSRSVNSPHPKQVLDAVSVNGTAVVMDGALQAAEEEPVGDVTALAIDEADIGEDTDVIVPLADGASLLEEAVVEEVIAESPQEPVSVEVGEPMPVEVPVVTEKRRGRKSLVERLILAGIVEAPHGEIGAGDIPAVEVEVPVAEEPIAVEPVAEEPVVVEPVAEEPVAAEPVAAEPVTEEPVAEVPVAEASLSAPADEAMTADAEDAPVTVAETVEPAQMVVQVPVEIVEVEELLPVVSAPAPVDGVTDVAQCNDEDLLVADGNHGVEEAETAEETVDSKESLSGEIVQSMKAQAVQEVRDVLQELESKHYNITEGMATAVGAGTGAAGSIAALSSLGAVSGLSSAGVSSGLAAAGALIGGGTLVGLGVIVAPVAALGVLGYRLAHKIKESRRSVDLGAAVKKICEIQLRLNRHREQFREELSLIDTTLDVLLRVKTK